ncbi:CatB-related O-acetyltransferase [uncultured Enorma sp.]|uniref:CatB-related O-acetyltransferase n=1 Tax=uncultured Enorma sp. TaxID=1714346 RepID=UPI00259A4C25|nr:CatB-related O-acetyltransferase [uncultured Enorma sp.]
MTFKSSVRSAIEHLKFRRYLKEDVSINVSATVRGVEFEGLNKVGARTRVFNSRFGYGSYVANDSVLAGVSCGRYCSLGPNISTPTGLHPTSGFASTSPLFFSTKGQLGTTYVNRQKYDECRFAGDGYLRVIGNDVWIGGNVVILEGVTIGDGAIVGAGSVVTKDLPPYSISVGVPAKVVKYRFDQQTIERLCRTRWWDRTPDWVRLNADAFENVAELLALLEREPNC